MVQHIFMMTLLVRDYDEAIAFYVDKLGFELLEDRADPGERDAGKRWVVIGSKGSGGGARLLLARAVGDAELTSLGAQTGGRVSFFLQTDDFWRDYRAYLVAGVEFPRGEPREEAYGTVVVFTDLYGNLWDLIEPARPAQA